MCEKHGVSEELNYEIRKISQIIIKQNYFQGALYIQEEGLAMGAPTSSIFSEIYLKHIENTVISDILVKYHIVEYFLYADDSLIVYNKGTTNVYDVFNVSNNIMPTMKFTIEEEKENRINFLDIAILKEKDNISFDIYRKPTATYSIIPKDSCHPHEHKLAATRYLDNRMEIYNLNATNKEKENNTIKQILCNHKYDISILNKSTTTENKVKQNTSKTKWAKFTYVGKETKFITKLFKNTPLRIAFTTRNTVEKLLSKQQKHNQSKFDKY